ncbi:hypothetical protein ACIBSV_46865 [Embleya sp. NPDC050154]|uniref:hypothetical protein n=1 Tax=Embleya sp. NPDC050154 TaxID=3363988 RepID=UPI0037B735F4
MKLRIPRLRRAASGTVSEYRPDPDSILVRLSPGGVHCTRCGQSRTGDSIDPEALGWLSGHDCTEETS